MKKAVIDFNETVGKIKIMNAVNNGPLPYTEERTWSNFDDYKKAAFPYARTHDASFCAQYGGEHTVDVAFIFPDFDADVNDEKSYDFQLTDEYLSITLAAGTEPFFRLGSKIEHWSKKYNTIPPKDFLKWAQICEHIIAHYTEGWANGFRYKIDYWEIWNEADGRPDDAPANQKECWGGTKAQFFDFYEIVAKRLKTRFPHLKIGGPACTQVDAWINGRYVVMPWVDSFLRFLRDNQVPLDFFSWHGYTNRAENYVRSARITRKALDKYGFAHTESILNEWNYLDGWSNEDFNSSIQGIIGIRGAAFNAAVISSCQNAPVDMLMYYDAQPGIFNGLFDYYTQKPLPAYYVFLAFDKLRKIGNQVKAVSYDKEIYVLAAKNEEKKAFFIAYYPWKKNFFKQKPRKNKKISLFVDAGKCACYILDKKHNLCRTNDVVFQKNRAELELTPHSFYYMEVIE